MLVAIVAVYGLFALHRTFGGPRVRLGLMQPDVRSDELKPRSAAEDLAKFRALAGRLAGQPMDLMVWPETVSPTDAINDFVSRNVFVSFARAGDAYVLVGTTYFDEQDREYNSAALFSPAGDLVDRYDKHWLVPMGEWTWGRGWLPFLSVFHVRDRDVQPGTTDLPVAAGSIRMRVLICYESVFPILARTGAAHGANLLVSITNDSWAGRSSELRQHSAMTLFRAVETRRYTASSATTGITGIIDPCGRIQSLPPYREDARVYEARLLSGQTFYVRFGDWFVALCAIVMLLAIWAPWERGVRATSRSGTPGG